MGWDLFHSKPRAVSLAGVCVKLHAKMVTELTSNEIISVISQDAI